MPTFDIFQLLVLLFGSLVKVPKGVCPSIKPGPSGIHSFIDFCVFYFYQ